MDEFLLDAFRPGMEAGALYALYTMFGDDPFISTADRARTFSAWTMRGRGARRCVLMGQSDREEGRGGLANSLRLGDATCQHQTINLDNRLIKV